MNRAASLAVLSVAWITLLDGLATEASAQPAERFERMDRDGDGRISRSELGRPRLFERLDADGDGFVTRSEARELLEGRRKRRAPRRAERTRPGGDGAADSTSSSATVEVTTHRYGRRAIQSLDIHAPGGTGLPVAVYVHGGAHVTGDKANVHAKASGFTKRGYVFVSVNYRLGEEGKGLANARDVASALGWVKANIARHGGDPSRLVLMGHSTGAQLAALVATDGSLLAEAGMSPTEIDAVILLDTSQYDIASAFASGGLTDRADRHFRAFYGPDPDFWRRASPISHVAPGKPIAPTFIAAARREGVRALSDAFAQALRRAGALAVRHDDTAKDHQGMNRAFGQPGDTTTEAAFRFLEQHVPR